LPDTNGNSKRRGPSTGVRPENADGDEAGDDSREHHADGKQDPAKSPPEIAIRGPLSKHVSEVSCAIRDVCQYRQEKQPQDRIERKNCLRCGIGSKEIKQDDYAEKRVMRQAPRLPESRGV